MASEMNPVGWFEIYVRDIGRAKSFYEAVLGVNLTKIPQSGDSLDEMWGFPMHRDGGGATGALAKMDGAPVGAGGTIVYFVCDDCAEQVRRTKEADGRVVAVDGAKAVEHEPVCVSQRLAALHGRDIGRLEERTHLLRLRLAIGDKHAAQCFIHGSHPP